MKTENMSNYYSSNSRFYVGIDCIIFDFNGDELSLLLLKRNFKPAMGNWLLVSEFIRESESVDDAAEQVPTELTGLGNVYMERVGSFGAIDRGPGERIISIAYCTLVNINEYDRDLVQQHNAFWVDINELSPLIFDYPAAMEKVHALMQQKVTTEPIGFNLLPQPFMFSRLQSPHEAIYGENINKRNFRKGMAEMGHIEGTDEIDKINSERGAALYKFNRRTYRRVPRFEI